MGERYIQKKVCIGEPFFWELRSRLFKNRNKVDKCMAWALMREYSLVEADLMMIYASEEHGGFATELMRGLQMIYKVIRTSWDASTKEGRKLCLRTDFKHEGELLVWKQEEEDAIKIEGADEETLRNETESSEGICEENEES